MKGTASMVILLTTVCNAITENSTTITKSTIEDSDNFNTTEIQTTNVPSINQTETVTPVNLSENNSVRYSNRTGNVSIDKQDERSAGPTPQEVAKNNLYTLIKIRLLGNLLQRLPVERRQFIFINAIKQVSRDANKESNEEKKAKAFSMQHRSFDDSTEHESGSQEISRENIENSQEKSPDSGEEEAPQHNAQTQLELQVIKDQVSNDVEHLLNTVFPGVESNPSQRSVLKDMKSDSAIQYKPSTVSMQNRQHTNSPLKIQSASHSFNHVSTKSHTNHDSRISGFTSTDYDTHHVPTAVQRDFNFEKTHPPPMHLSDRGLLSRPPYLGEYPHQEEKVNANQHSTDPSHVYSPPPSTTPYTVYQQTSLHSEPFQESLNLKPVIYSDSSEKLPLSVTYFNKGTGKTADSKENTNHLDILKILSQNDEATKHNVPQHTSTNSVESDTSKSSEEEILSDLKFDSTTIIPNLDLHPSEDVQDYYDNHLLKSDQTNAEDAVKIIFDLFNDYDDHFEDYDNEKLNFDIELYPTSTSTPIQNTQNHTSNTNTVSHTFDFAAREENVHHLSSTEVRDTNEDSSSSEGNEWLTTDHQYTRQQSQQPKDTQQPSSQGLEAKKDKQRNDKGNGESSNSQEITDTTLDSRKILSEMTIGSITQSNTYTKKTDRNAEDVSSSEEHLMTSQVLPKPLHSHFSNERYSEVSKEEEERIYGFDSEEEYGRHGSDSEKTNSNEKDIYDNQNVLHDALQSKGSSVHVNQEESTQNLFEEISKEDSNEQSVSKESSEKHNPWYLMKLDEDSTVKSKDYDGKNNLQYEESSSASMEENMNKNHFSQSEDASVENYDINGIIKISFGSGNSGEDTEKYVNSESKEGDGKSLLPGVKSLSFDNGGKSTHQKASSSENDIRMERKNPNHNKESYATEDTTESEEYANSESKEEGGKSLLPRVNSISFDNGDKSTHQKASSSANDSKMERKNPIYNEDSYSTEDTTESEEYANSESKEEGGESLLPRVNSVSFDNGGKSTHQKASSSENDSKIDRKNPIRTEGSYSTEDANDSEEFDGNSKTVDTNSDESSSESKIENSESKIETSTTEKSADSDSTEINDDKNDGFQINNSYTREDQSDNSDSSEESNIKQLYINSDSAESGEIQLQKDSISKEKSNSIENQLKISHTSVSSESYSENKSFFRDDDKGSSSRESEDIDSSSKDISCEGKYCSSYEYSSESTSFGVDSDDSEEKEVKDFDYVSSKSTEDTNRSDEDDTEEISGQDSNETSEKNDRANTGNNAASEIESASKETMNSISSEEQTSENSIESKSDSDEHFYEERILFDTNDNDSSENLDTEVKTKENQLRKVFSSESKEYNQNEETKNGHDSNEKSNDDKQIIEYDSHGMSNEHGTSTSDEKKDQSNEDMAYSQKTAESSEQRADESKVENEESGKEHNSEESQEQLKEKYLEEERGYSNDHEEPKEQQTEETTNKYERSKDEAPKEQDIVKDNSNKNSIEEPSEEHNKDEIKDEINRNNSDEEPKDLIETGGIEESREGSSGEGPKDDDTTEEKGEGSNEKRSEELTDNKKGRTKWNEENPTEKKQEDYGKNKENDNEEDTSMVEHNIYEKNEEEYPENKEYDDKSNCKDETSDENNSNKNDNYDEMNDEIRDDDELENAVEMISDMFLFGFDESSSGKHTDYDTKKNYNTHMKYENNGRVKGLLKKLVNLQQFWQRKKSGYGSLKAKDSPNSSNLQMKLPTLKHDLYGNPPRRRTIYSGGSYSNYKRSKSHKSRNHYNPPSYRSSSYGTGTPLNYNGGAYMPYESTFSTYLPSQWKYLYKLQSSNTRPRSGKSGYRSRRLKINFGKSKNNFRKNYSESRTRNGLSRLSDILINRPRNSTHGFRRVSQGSDNSYTRNQYDQHRYMYEGNNADDSVIVHPVVTKSNY
ncbi:dentin sialophosphoprotein-like [Ostrea edulis]|uniref:dentin sialophosphoprotein-like n=1 Tax=Ostrea edulis TaxID=37623 RepID=UPI0024AFA10A|nr:dentin sialophosphoprotein-like [Ostrea edulis]